MRIDNQERRGLAELIRQLPQGPELTELRKIMLGLRHAAQDCDLQSVAAFTLKLDRHLETCRQTLRVLQGSTRAAKSPKLLANFVDNREKSHNSATIEEYDVCTVRETVERETI